MMVTFACYVGHSILLVYTYVCSFSHLMTDYLAETGHVGLQSIQQHGCL